MNDSFFVLKGFYFFNTTSEDNYLQSSHTVELYNGPEILMQISAVTIACIYSFWQQYKLLIKLFPMILSFE